MAKTKKTTRPEIKTLKTEDFRQPEELGIKLPALVLGIEVDPRNLNEESVRDYEFRPGRQWHKIEHQTAGHRCNQRYIVGSVLAPKNPDVTGSIYALTTKWFDSQISRGTTLDCLVEYREDLRRLFKADCNRSHGKLEEGVYPLDIEFLSQLAADVLPKDLDDLLVFETGWQRACGCIGRWGLYILSTNSD